MFSLKVEKEFKKNPETQYLSRSPSNVTLKSRIFLQVSKGKTETSDTSQMNTDLEPVPGGDSDFN